MHKVSYIGSLIAILDELKNVIVMSSDVSIDQRSHAISEIFYYSNLLDSFFDYSVEDQTEIILGVLAMSREVNEWYE
jgi:hypothetical protein